MGYAAIPCLKDKQSKAKNKEWKEESASHWVTHVWQLSVINKKLGKVLSWVVIPTLEYIRRWLNHFKNMDSGAIQIWCVNFPGICKRNGMMPQNKEWPEQVQFDMEMSLLGITYKALEGYGQLTHWSHYPLTSKLEFYKAPSLCCTQQRAEANQTQRSYVFGCTLFLFLPKSSKRSVNTLRPWKG